MMDTLIYLCSAAITFNIFLTTMALSPVAVAYRYMWVPLNLAVDSVVACLVFRGVKLGYITDADDRTLTTLRFAPRNHSAAMTSVAMSNCGIHDIQPSNPEIV
jgi:hypothetical protein